VQLQEENSHLKENVKMFDQRMIEMEKNLETSKTLLSLLKDHFVEYEDPLTIVMVDFDKHIVQLMKLGEKVIQMDSW
jgi:hypothetical protein